MSSFPGPGQLEAARDMLLQRLARYRQRKGHAITLVFDGWQAGFGSEHHEFQSGIEVIYSKRGERADQVIQRLARVYGNDSAVVSSDHEVVNAARAAGAFVIAAQEFRSKLQESSRSSPVMAFKELDEGDGEPVKRSKDKGGNPRKLPKAQRKRKQQLREF